jgi:hypothetical protein
VVRARVELYGSVRALSAHLSEYNLAIVWLYPTQEGWAAQPSICLVVTEQRAHCGYVAIVISRG